MISLIIIVVFIGVSVTKEVFRRLEMKYEIDQMETEIARLSQRNTEMKDLIGFLNTSSSQDKEARVKLGLQGEGEQVVMFPDQRSDQQIVLPDSDKIDYIQITGYKSNPEKWFYFFWDRMVIFNS
ncbi:septum formation initiator family protein [Patescibacteria group bacterium]